MKGNLRVALMWCAAMTLVTFVSGAHANFHLFRIRQIYTNADGTVQFVVLSTLADNEHVWTGHYIKGIDSDGITERTFTFPTNLPDDATGGKSALIATQGFAALGLIAPDYVVPDNFINTSSGSVDFAGVDTISYGSGQLPTDGTHSLMRDGTKAPNLAANFAGKTASVVLPGSPAVANYQGLWWKAPASSEDGWGINFTHQGDTIFASWFTYDIKGRGWWLVMTAPKTAPNTYTGDLFEVSGPPFNALPFGKTVSNKVGTATLTFADVDHGTFAYNVNGIAQQKSITRQSFGPMPTCTYGTQPNLALATNYQDLWWNAPANSESGWGINFTHQGDTVFATWFTYDTDGTPMWLVTTASKKAPGVYEGDLLRTSGARFDAFKSGDVKVLPRIGTAKFTFADGNHATFDYTVQLAGMPSAVTQSKTITRQIFAAPGTTCK